MKTPFPISLPKNGGAFKCTKEQAALFLTQNEINRGESRGNLVTFGMWQIPVSYRAMTAEQSFEGEDYSTKHSHPLVIHGRRKMFSIRPSGYALEGWVSLNGKRRRAFTSSALLDIEGKLVNIEIIHVCNSN